MKTRTTKAVRPFASVAAALAAFATLSYNAHAQSLNTLSSWEYMSAVNSMGQAGDINGDGYNDLVLGNPAYSNGQSNEGQLLVFYGSSTGFASSPDWSSESNITGANLGWSLVTAGDINNDGYSDIVSGAPGANKIMIYYGSAAGPLAPVTVTGSQSGEQFGTAIAVSDINNDSYPEIFVGAPGYTTSGSVVGRVYGFKNSSTGIISTPAFSINGNGHNSAFGATLAIGSVTGSGKNLIIGAPGGDSTVIAAVVVTDTLPTNLDEPPTKKFVLTDGTSGSRFGYSIAIAGDINKDGYEDVLIGAPDYSNNLAKAGRVVIYQGGSLAQLWSLQGSAANAQLGTAVAGKGKLNNDSYDDIAITSPGATANKIIVYTGTSTGLSSLPKNISTSDDISAITFFRGINSGKDGIITAVTATTDGGASSKSKYIREFEDFLLREGLAANNTAYTPEVAAYPNPAVNTITFTVPVETSEYNASIDIVNTLGMTVFSSTEITSSATSAQNITLELPALPRGIYHAVIHIGGQTFFKSIEIAQ